VLDEVVQVEQIVVLDERDARGNVGDAHHVGDIARHIAIASGEKNLSATGKRNRSVPWRSLR